MKRALITGAGLLVTVALAAADVPRVTRSAVVRLEARLDADLTGGEHPSDLLNNTRGVYLDGYGAVFMTTLSLVPTPVPNPFHSLTKADIATIHEHKVHQVPFLKNKMRDALFTLAASPQLEGVRGAETIVCDVSLFYYSWEDASGLPMEITMRGQKQSLLDARAGRTAPDSVVKIEEQ